MHTVGIGKEEKKTTICLVWWWNEKIGAIMYVDCTRMKTAGSSVSGTARWFARANMAGHQFVKLPILFTLK